MNFANKNQIVTEEIFCSVPACDKVSAFIMMLRCCFKICDETQQIAKYDIFGYRVLWKGECPTKTWSLNIRMSTENHC